MAGEGLIPRAKARDEEEFWKLPWRSFFVRPKELVVACNPGEQEDKVEVSGHGTGVASLIFSQGPGSFGGWSGGK